MQRVGLQITKSGIPDYKERDSGLKRVGFRIKKSGIPEYKERDSGKNAKGWTPDYKEKE